MKSTLRLALPPLASVTQDAVVTYALRDRSHKLLRSGQLSLRQLAHAIPAARVQAVLHPDDAIVTHINLPPLANKRLTAAVQASVEPMALSNISDLCIAHGPRAADGSVCVTWADRPVLLQAWNQLETLGFKVDALVPFSLAIPQDDPQPTQPLALPVNERWSTTLPHWSLARPEWRPVSQSKRWRSPLLWLGAAIVLWLAGLQLYAAQLRHEVNGLRTATESAVRDAFPSVSIILDPIKQARSQRDMLRLEHGTTSADAFIPLAIGAAQILPFAEGHVAAVRYEKNILTLVLNEGYEPPSNEVTLHQAAAALSLDLEKDPKTAHTWHIRHTDMALTTKVQP
ncbi:type II secretion system protein GspL [Pollutimonas harenae]|uniref:General secretion pathway protein GspL n=1 Tax=Pollutimonas harenae TaxID=657015 RepID=A0A853GSC9_9BURK|nr:type II secretion system protein GspL [Pollutimonas harenae]NYT86008.1 general secretion pathway protein GspL [Pollutimonas harenae]TEA71056.1 general secretion pathway protein GspL [Pollutimonas harenae]